MFESRSCSVCRQFNREAAPLYEASPAAHVFPLRRIDIDRDPTDILLERPVTMTPTFVFVDKRREIARFVGYPGRKWFFKLVNGAAAAFVESEAKKRRAPSGQ